MLRFLRFHSLRLARRYPRSDNSLVAKMLRSDLIHWDHNTVPRGVALGMFWAFIPIPFQMVPATIFCWMVRGNLPVALLCVWITNPLTLPPILLLEYRIGQFLVDFFQDSEKIVSLAEATSTVTVFAGGLRLILAGGLVLSCVSMVAGYLIMRLLFLKSSRPARQRRGKN